MENTYLKMQNIGPYEIDYRKIINHETGNLDVDKAKNYYQETALKIIDQEVSPSLEDKKRYLNFFCDVAPIRGNELAAYLNVSRAQVSQWRNDNQKDISSQSWNLIRLFFAELFEHGEVKNRVFKKNKNLAAVA